MRKPKILPTKELSWDDINTLEVIKYMKSSRHVDEYKRLLSVLMRKRELSLKNIALFLNESENTLKHWHSKCLEGGPLALLSHRRGGRYRQDLSLEEEAEIIKRYTITQTIKPSIDVKVIHEALKKRFGGEVHPSYTYNLLKRHGWGVKTSHIKVIDGPPIPRDVPFKPKKNKLPQDKFDGFFLEEDT